MADLLEGRCTRDHTPIASHLPHPSERSHAARQVIGTRRSTMHTQRGVLNAAVVQQVMFHNILTPAGVAHAQGMDGSSSDVGAASLVNQQMINGSVPGVEGVMPGAF